MLPRTPRLIRGRTGPKEKSWLLFPNFSFLVSSSELREDIQALMVPAARPWTWFQRAQVGSAKSASAIQDSVRIFTSRLEPLSPCHVCLIQVGVPVGAAILGTTFTVLAVSAAKRDQRRFEERSQRERAVEVCLLSRPVWSRRFFGRLSSDGCRNMLAE